MNERTKMIISESLILWAFGCAIDHYDAAAVILGVFTAGWLVHIYESAKIRPLLLRGLLAADLCLLAAHVTGLSAVIPSAGFIIALNAFYAVMTLANSYQLMDEAVRWFIGLTLVYTALSLIVPNGQFTSVQLLTLILLMFAPVLLVYAVRTVTDEPEGKYHGSAL